jgi:hypothetical protein
MRSPNKGNDGIAVTRRLENSIYKLDKAHQWIDKKITTVSLST